MPARALACTPMDRSKATEPAHAGGQDLGLTLDDLQSFVFGLEDVEMLRDAHDVEDLDDERLDVAEVELGVVRRRHVVRHDDQAHTTAIDDLDVLEVQHEVLVSLVDLRLDRLLQRLLQRVGDVEVEAAVVEQIIWCRLSKCGGSFTGCPKTGPG